jgi:hypothetical protein
MATELKYLEIETLVDDVGNYNFKISRRGFRGAWKTALGLLTVAISIALFGYARGQLYQPLFIKVKQEQPSS